MKRYEPPFECTLSTCIGADNCGRGIKCTTCGTTTCEKRRGYFNMFMTEGILSATRHYVLCKKCRDDLYDALYLESAKSRSIRLHNSRHTGINEKEKKRQRAYIAKEIRKLATEVVGVIKGGIAEFKQHKAALAKRRAEQEAQELARTRDLEASILAMEKEARERSEAKRKQKSKGRKR